MQKQTFIKVVIVMLAFASYIRADVSVIANGSFEYDGVISDIAEQPPQRWPDVNLAADACDVAKFGGWVKTDWQTDGNCSLTVFSKGPTAGYTPDFNDGDEATICQLVYLADANQINFDVKLTSPLPSVFPWTPEKRTAIVYINDIIAWHSDALGPSEHGDGVYPDRQIVLDDVNGLDKYAGPHTLKLAMRVNVDGEPSVAYHARWDFLAFDAHCDGFGYLIGDLDHDCYIDMFDLKLFAEQWLQEPALKKHDLFEDEDFIVNGRDFSVLGNNWMGTSYGREDELLAGDFNNDGIVNLIDFAIVAKEWGSQAFDYDDISILSDEWLDKYWLYWME